MALGKLNSLFKTFTEFYLLKLFRGKRKTQFYEMWGIILRIYRQIKEKENWLEFALRDILRRNTLARKNVPYILYKNLSVDVRSVKMANSDLHTR